MAAALSPPRLTCAAHHVLPALHSADPCRLTQPIIRHSSQPIVCHSRFSPDHMSLRSSKPPSLGPSPRPHAGPSHSAGSSSSSSVAGGGTSRRGSSHCASGSLRTSPPRVGSKRVTRWARPPSPSEATCCASTSVGSPPSSDSRGGGTSGLPKSPRTARSPFCRLPSVEVRSAEARVAAVCSSAARPKTFSPMTNPSGAASVGMWRP
mmetsp:Transcript_73294/g.201278  ORF Transcript_73294/g.201278 Transcript_73294/m.201278 type:complete len:207 (+) Transcript_73294:369-989(+)